MRPKGEIWVTPKKAFLALRGQFGIRDENIYKSLSTFLKLISFIILIKILLKFSESFPIFGLVVYMVKTALMYISTGLVSDFFVGKNKFMDDGSK